MDKNKIDEFVDNKELLVETLSIRLKNSDELVPWNSNITAHIDKKINELGLNKIKKKK